MIEFRVEWQQATGVRDRVLARTWCRLTIEADGQVVTRAIDNRARSVRDGVYGSAFPLCGWIVENWWFLQHEAYRFRCPLGSRDLARNSDDRAWVRRHSLLAAREGGALPDLTLFRDGDAVVARWRPDDPNATHPFLRFASEGQTRMTVEAAEHGLASFVDCVLERVDDLEAPEIDAFRRDWAAISEATADEREFCGWSARLGMDPYDPDELTDQHERFIRASVSPLEAELREDLLDASTADGLPEDLAWIAAAHDIASSADTRAASKPERPSTPTVLNATAHEAGYECARALRQILPVSNGGAVTDVRNAMQEFGWGQSPLLTTPSKPASLIDAMVDRSPSGAAVVVAPADCGFRQERFRLARALFLHHFAATPGRRLVTSAHTWDQRASRAFAAEFLAPAAALAKHVGARISLRDIDELADEYQVSPLVVEHQIENHRLGSLTDA